MPMSTRGIWFTGAFLVCMGACTANTPSDNAASSSSSGNGVPSLGIAVASSGEGSSSASQQASSAPTDASSASASTGPTSSSGAGTTSSSMASAGVRYLLDNFERGNRVVQPNSSDPGTRFLWGMYLSFDSDTGTTAPSNAEHHDGAHALASTLDHCGGSSCWQAQLYTYTEDAPGFSNGWQYMRRFVEQPETYQTNRINRMRLWIKVPPGIPFETNGSETLQFGTFTRESSAPLSDGETDNGHWYHHYNIGYTGEWHQVIVDTHPNHQRSGPGSTEWGDRLHPTGEASLTYFDVMTRFYFDSGYTSVPAGAAFYLDGFELYEETRPENVEQVYSLNAVYIPSSQTIRVGWMRQKTENQVVHEVRYAFEDIFATGFAAATPAPGGMITPPGHGGYNGMSYTTTQIDVSGHSTIYVAIKPQNATSFRQIAVPLQ